MANPNLTPEKYKQLVDDLDVAKPVVKIADLDIGRIDVGKRVVYLRSERPSRLRRIINWILRRSDIDKHVLMGTSYSTEWTSPIGVALEDGKILFQPTYSADEDIEVTVRFEDDDNG